MTTPTPEFKRGDRVVTRQGKVGTVSMWGPFRRRIYVRMEPYGEERHYDPRSIRHQEKS